ncbi:MAG: 3-deoxy-D-manno-octulosonic acid transferase, partial [Bacteroidales bacterium]|jgi:3-deoxy-D-manno-octulosonic-acid transferase|nr:3-deoxy-D-manno-octulosonic acid transferase [Bacteroidales bacterium]
VIWFHAASLGEFEQGRPVIEQFRNQHPDWKILLTFFSPSGYEIRKNYAHADCIVYLPFDTPKNAKKFAKLVQPKIAIFIKYEFWYNYLNALKKQHVRTFFVSTIFRPSQYFFKWYGGWTRKQLRAAEHFFVQNQESENLLKSIGFTNVTISGDTRFDRVSEILQTKKSFPIIEAFKGNKKLLVVGSSWPADEKLICDAISKFPNFKFLFVPHEIDEAHLQKLERLIPTPFLRYSAVETHGRASLQINDVQVMIVDQIGYLSQLYQYADIAYIGGGFEKSGIHNILEAAVFGIPILFGPNYKKFQEAHDLIALGAAKSISTTDEFVVETHGRASLQELPTKAANYVNQKTGATSIILTTIK